MPEATRLFLPVLAEHPGSWDSRDIRATAQEISSDVSMSRQAGFSIEQQARRP
jgi:hypothetical protein